MWAVRELNLKYRGNWRVGRLSEILESLTREVGEKIFWDGVWLRDIEGKEGLNSILGYLCCDDRTAICLP